MEQSDLSPNCLNESKDLICPQNEKLQQALSADDSPICFLAGS